MLKRGRPVVLLANENFIDALEGIAAAAGVPNLPYVVFPTNIDGLPEAEIADMGKARLHEIVDKLVAQTEASLAGRKLAV